MSQPHPLAEQLQAQNFRRLHASSWLFILLDLTFTILLPFLLGYYNLVRGLPTIWKVAIAGIFFLIFLYLFAHFYSTQFMIRSDDIILKRGILYRKQRYIPLNKVHNITLKRNLLHRWLNVAEVRLETAGTGNTAEAELRVLSYLEAKTFENLIEKPTPETNAPTTANLLPLSRRELLYFGLLRNDGFVLMGIILSFALNSDNFTQWLTSKLPSIPLFLQIFQQHWLGAFFLFICAAFILGKLLTILFAFLNYSQFELTDSPTHITLRRGLLTRIESHVPREKIQVWRITQPPLYRLCNRYRLYIDTAVFPNNNERGIRELIPLANDEITCQLIKRWNNIEALSIPVHAQHPKAPHRLTIKYLLIQSQLMIGAVILYFLNLIDNQQLLDLAILWLILQIINPIAAKKRYAIAGWAIDNKHYLHWRDGWLWRKHHFAHCQHLHCVDKQQNPFDRRYPMATLLADTMGSNRLSSPLKMRYLKNESADNLLTALKNYSSIKAVEKLTINPDKS
ncbi:PH domain-containing protein [Suttonella ornithocola]|uniref:Bacterial membrane flanked domain n=1 Tax=Suttonella ornithocola TaxID=279832 RepID=A0A380MUA9_9GAMM|nr:PH domain-containing protein [Suttonella ornithocola]SUO95764.1 Bacterial membrane flanked domain [Suttonella ornithocola]